jgi:hypothetical protein
LVVKCQSDLVLWIFRSRSQAAVSSMRASCRGCGGRCIERAERRVRIRSDRANCRAKRGIATKERWACNAVRSARPAVSLRRRCALLWMLRLSWTSTTVLARGKWTSAKFFKTCAYSMAVPLFAAQNRLEPFFHQLPAHAVEHGGAGVQGLPDLLSLHPAPATTSAPLFYLRTIIAGAMRAAVLLLP